MQNNIPGIKQKKADPNLWLKRGVWLYFLLLIFEGGLRKWVFPGLATPLLIVRDPLAIWLIFSVWNRGLMPSSPLLTAMIWINIASIFTALFFGHGNLIVAFYGARIFLIHFPLIFVIGRIFDREDVLKMGRVLLWISIPMVVLIALQFYSPQSAFINRGVGGDLNGGGFSGANGYFRPPATFSFTNGTHLFFSLTACFLFYFWLNPKGTSKILLYLATFGLVAAIPLSISRSLTFFTFIALAFALITVFRKPANLIRAIFAGIIIFVLLSVLSRISMFQTATDAFLSRFTAANEAEGGLKGTLGGRYLGSMTKAVSTSADQPFFGFGTGMGTNAGSKLLTGTSQTFLISEEEWGRLVGELGALMGISVILIRLALSFKLLKFSVRKMLAGDTLPWMLMSYGLLVIPQGQWAQPTSLGFGALIGGLIFASLKTTTSLLPQGQITELKENSHIPDLIKI
jgi:hypothetical protein